MRPHPSATGLVSLRGTWAPGHSTVGRWPEMRRERVRLGSAAQKPVLPRDPLTDRAQVPVVTHCGDAQHDENIDVIGKTRSSRRKRATFHPTQTRQRGLHGSSRANPGLCSLSVARGSGLTSTALVQSGSPARSRRSRLLSSLTARVSIGGTGRHWCPTTPIVSGPAVQGDEGW